MSIQDQDIEAVIRSPTEMDLLSNAPLHLAAQSDASKNVNIQDKDGRTPLHLAAQSDAYMCIDSLWIDNTDVNFNIQDKDGRTPLHLAAQSDAFMCIHSLLKDSTDVNVNIQDKDGRTPLHLAPQSGWEYFLQKFLEHGADPSDIKSLWQSRLGSGTVKEIPGLLKLWENAANGFDYGTIDTLVKDISMADNHVTIDSIVWEWEFRLSSISVAPLESSGARPNGRMQKSMSFS
ncbi:hypothetical protein GJ744_009113 [Endocarpon pusillum]|uniref:Uncharacterized protein n=1 Tax=Endocarpon pusillum TaxID=364733 RepID=A0A8H7AJH9_9EURO|nr:hypothetical protein GJ744_009113 [Endocarpon pusillum]